MTKKNILLLILLFASLRIIAQDNVESNKIVITEDSTKISKEFDDESLLSDPVFYSPSIFSTSSFDYLSSLYVGVPLNPLIWNVNLNDTTSQPRFLFTPFNQEVRYFGLGSYNNIGASFLWMLTGRLSLDGSAFISKQYGFVLASNQGAYGASLGLNYKLTNILQLRLYGQYVTPANEDPFINASDLFSKTKAGAELIVEPKDNLKFGGGVEYQYNQKEQNWKPKTGAKISVGF